MAEDPLDHRPTQDGRDDLQFPAAAGRAALHVDAKDSLEQPCPADAARPGRGLLALTLGSRCLNDLLLIDACRSLPHPLRPQAFGASTPWNLIRCSRGRGTNAASRCTNTSGDITPCMVPSRLGV